MSIDKRMFVGLLQMRGGAEVRGGKIIELYYLGIANFMARNIVIYYCKALIRLAT